MKIYTCAFLPFAADEPFFARDSGQLCKALVQLGHDSKVIMPGFPDGRPNDSDAVIRGSMTELHDPNWWRSLRIEAVAFICWGFREHTPIIRAAAEGGVTTCAVFDSNCNGFPYFDFFSTIRSNWRKGYLSETILKRVVGTLARMSIFLVKGLFQNYHAYAQARAAHLSAYNSRSSFERAKRRARIFGGHEIIPSMRLMGYPIPDGFAPQPAEKRIKKMVAVARWDAVRWPPSEKVVHVE